MAFFTESVLDDGIVLENKEMYTSEYGMDTIMMECAEFDKETFTDLVMADFREMAMIREGASEEAIQEGVIDTLKKVGKKVIDFIKKWAAKIKTFIGNVVAKILGRFSSDNKKVFEKYKDKVKDSKDVTVNWVKDSKKCFEAADATITTADVQRMAANAEKGAVDKKDAAQIKKDIKERLKLSDDGENVSVDAVVKDLIGEEEETTFGKAQTDIERVLNNGDAAFRAVQASNKIAESISKTTEAIFKAPKENESDKYTKFRAIIMQSANLTNTFIKGQTAACQKVMRLARTAYIKAAK